MRECFQFLALLALLPGGFADAQEPFKTCAPGKCATLKADSLEYVLFVPNGAQASVKSGDERKFPLILLLHGAADADYSAAKHCNSSLLKHASTAAASKEGFPFFVVAPVMPGGRGNWMDYEQTILDIVDKVAEAYPIDKSRICLTGYSMGGFGAWSMAIKHPGLFSALAPVCGGGNPGDVGKIGGMPVWMFHGAKDNVVPLRRSQEMLDALRLCGNDAKLTAYPEIGHDSWKQAYADPELYKWLEKSSRVERAN